MNETQMSDIWLLLKEFSDEKLIETVAERYIDLLADHSVSDRALKELLGHDDILDEAIDYYLDQEDEHSYTDEE